MKLLSFINPRTGRNTWGVNQGGKIYDLGEKLFSQFPDLKSVLMADALSIVQEYPLEDADFLLHEVQFLPVIDNPNKIFCVGMNYMDKRKEFEQTIDAPTLFIRFADSLTAHGDSLCKPGCSDEFDYEGELAVIIGKYTSNVSREQALEHVAGYSCFMDGSVRDMQYTWFTSGKNWQKTGAFGPWLVTCDEINDPQNLSIDTWLNGQNVQHDSTKNMVRTVAELISYISLFSPLQPGDVIITGSPGGVGKKRNPPLFMKEGDVIEVVIGGIGKLKNKVSELACNET